MKFNVTYLQDTTLVSDNTEVNYPDMDEVKHGIFNGSHDKYTELNGYVFDSLPEVKRYLRRQIQEQKLTSTERYWALEEVREMSVATLIDALLEDYNSLSESYKGQKADLQTSGLALYQLFEYKKLILSQKDLDKLKATVKNLIIDPNKS